MAASTGPGGVSADPEAGPPRQGSPGEGLPGRQPAQPGEDADGGPRPPTLGPPTPAPPNRLRVSRSYRQPLPVQQKLIQIWRQSSFASVLLRLFEYSPPASVHKQRLGHPLRAAKTLHVPKDFLSKRTACGNSAWNGKEATSDTGASVLAVGDSGLQSASPSNLLNVNPAKPSTEQRLPPHGPPPQHLPSSCPYTQAGPGASTPSGASLTTSYVTPPPPHPPPTPSP